MPLGDKLQDCRKIAGCNIPLCYLSHNFCGNDRTEKEIHCKLQKTIYALRSRAAAGNGFNTIHAVVAESRIQFYFTQSMRAQKRCKKSCTGWYPLATCLTRPLQHKLQIKFHRVTLSVGSTFCNDWRDF